MLQPSARELGNHPPCLHAPFACDLHLASYALDLINGTHKVQEHQCGVGQ